MPERTMGSHTGLTTAQAATILGIPERTVLRMESDGLLRREGKYLNEQDVYELNTIRSSSRRSDSLLALKALTVSLRVERQLEELKIYLGMNSVKLEVEEEAVLSLFNKAKRTTRQDLLLRPVEEWARILIVIDEQYLTLVEAYTGEEEPWQPFTQIAHWLYEIADTHDTRVRVDYVRRNLRNVAYFYARRRYGRNKANQRFSDESFTTRLLNLIGQ